MSDNKSYRIKANVGKDNVLNVNLNQEFKTFELLSLKIDSDNLYKFHTSNYGCVAGRVLANGNFGVPNAKISIFIKATDDDLSDAIISYLYPYKNTQTKNDDGIRYNLLPDTQLSDCHRNVGTFPNKRLVLDDNNVFEVYDKYYKYTTRSNNAGDYMIFGVPVGEQTIHVDIDLSDIGILSQRPRDMVYKGYSTTQFENANMFKSDTNLDILTQIISQNANVNVYPFWGEDSENNIAITRKDIEVQYKFEPTCIFMGSIITDEKSNAISKKCIPSERMGKMDRLTTGNGTIEMIRKTPDGDIEEKIIQGNQLIDGNGVWCYQIPMNLDYVCTDEYGNIVPTDDPNKGVATRTRARFRLSLTEFETGAEFSHAAKTLVPHNPETEDELDYSFGSNTLDDEFGTKSFRDLFWNQVYSIKSYVPRFQQGNYNRNKRFSGIKEVNSNGSNNPLPYNNLRIDISFMFLLQCAIFHVLLKIVTGFNKFISWLCDIAATTCCSYTIDMGGEITKQAVCLTIGDGYCPDLQGWYFAPGCENGNAYNRTWSTGILNSEEDPASIEANNDDVERKCLTRNITYLVQCTEIYMAMEYDVIQFDFYNDWLNGVVYTPRWNAEIRKKRSYFFNLIRVSPRLNACSEENFSNTRRFVQQCSLKYSYDDATGGYSKVVSSNGCVSGSNRQRCHKAYGRDYVTIFGYNGGVVHRELTSSDKNVYYYKPCEWRYGTRRLFFATDIILIGSLNEDDPQGIPQMFKKLSSSTYRLPDALAGTNIGAEGFLYGADGGGHVCNKKLNNSEGVIVNEVEGNFDNLEKWSSGSDDYDGYPYDLDEKPVTETSGIDWGFSGPEQGSNDFNNLYFPGGHFLGISCLFSEVNVKSCVNLSRVCELGSTISHRQSYVVKDILGDEYIYSIPTGLISGDEIIDRTGKDEFATLNFNRLKTRRNQENNMMEYDFETIFPINFNGELIDKTNNGKYSRALSDYKFIRTIENGNKDYYRFRMGVRNGETLNKIREKYLISNSSTVSMPMYENSFYFYFGIKNGNTALEQFYKNFFAECPAINPYEPRVLITTENADVCDTDDGNKAKGKIIVNVENIDNAKCKISGGEYDGITEYINISPKYVFSGFTGVRYTVMVYGDNLPAITHTVEIKYEIPNILSGISYDVVNFKDGKKYLPEEFSGTCDPNVTGYISFNNISDIQNITTAVLISTKSHYHFLWGNKNIDLPFTGRSKINYGGVPGWLNQCYVWDGNNEYTIYLKIRCQSPRVGHNESIWIEYDKFVVEMPAVTDIVFDDNDGASYVNTIEKYSFQDPNKEITELLDDNSISENIRNAFKKSLFFNESKYSASNSHNMVVSIEGDLENTKNLKLYGDFETINSDFITCSALQELDFSTLSAFYVPTLLMPKYEYLNISKLWDIPLESSRYSPQVSAQTSWNTPIYGEYVINGSHSDEKKDEYIVRYHNNELFKMNSPYLPFYFKAVFMRFSSIGRGNAVSLAVVNAIKSSSTTRLKKVVANNEDISSSIEYDEYYNISQLTALHEMFGNSFCIEDMYYVDSTKEGGVRIGAVDGVDNEETETSIATPYTISIEDNAGRKLEGRVESYFIGDRDSNGNLLPFIKESKNHIRYYVVPKSFLTSSTFESYYKVNETEGSNNRKTYYPKGKRIASDKLMNLLKVNENIWVESELRRAEDYLIERKIEGAEANIRSFDVSSRFFPSMNIGSVWWKTTLTKDYFHDTYHCVRRDYFEPGEDYTIWNLWPYNGKQIKPEWDKLDTQKKEVFWTSAVLLPGCCYLKDQDTRNYGYSGCHFANNFYSGCWLSDEMPDGTDNTEYIAEYPIYRRNGGGYYENYSDDYCVLGVYDKDFHYQKNRWPEIVLNGDKHSSSIVILRAYTLEEFDNYREELGLIQR